MEVPFYPFIHTIWYDCVGSSLMSCKRGPLPIYRPPGNSQPVPNRYTFLLVQYPKQQALTFRGREGTALQELLERVSRHMKLSPMYFSRFDFARFLSENRPPVNAQVVSWNYMLVGEW